MKSAKLTLVVLCIVVSSFTAVGRASEPFLATNPFLSLETARDWEKALLSGKVRAMTSAQWDDYMTKLRLPDNEMEGNPYPTTQFVPPDLTVYVNGGSAGASEAGNFHPPDPGLIMAWGDATLPEGPAASAWMLDYLGDPDLSNVTISITVFAPNDPNINTISFGIKDLFGNIRSWHWDVPSTIPHDTATTVTINASLTGLAATSPPANGYQSNLGFDITQALFFIVDENCQWVNGPATIPPPGETVLRPWNYWKNLSVTPNPSTPGLVAGINIDIHQDIDNPDIEPNDFHIEGRIESGLPIGEPGGGGWGDWPTLLSHIDGDGNFPNFTYTIEADTSDTSQNWYIFRATWWSDTTIPFCTVIHLGLEFELTCHNVIVDLKGWWTRNGQRVGTTTVNKGYVPMIGFRVMDNILHPPDPCWDLNEQLCRTQVLRLYNGDDRGGEGTVDIEMIALSLTGMSPILLHTQLGPDPLRELTVGGLQESLTWMEVEDPCGVTISTRDPVDFPADSFFDVYINLDTGGNNRYHPPEPVRLRPGDFLLAKQKIRFTNNAGQTEERWVFQMHKAHEQESDLGDAPDSTNSFGAAMTAYPWGVMADFPTVYAAGSPPHGPIHLMPKRVAHLGRAVTREEEADIGFDQDPSNNIRPLADQPDLDLADDGVLGMPLKLPYCRQTRFRYIVNVINTTVPLYTNVWFDFNRDGDWDDTPQCTSSAGGPVDVPEWAVQNQPITAGSLPLGLNTLVTPAFTSWHPGISTSANQPIWMRITLSEEPWSGSGSAGSSPVDGYQFGETEDYLFIPKTGRYPNPDLNQDGIVNFFEINIVGGWWIEAIDDDFMWVP